MTTVTVTQQTKQVVTVTQQTKPSITLYWKGDPGTDGTDGVDGDSALIAWVANMFTTGVKVTAVDAGVLSQISNTDDYIYVCVQAGTAETTVGAKDGTAKWKKYVLFQSV